MLLRNRTPGLDSHGGPPAPGLEHIAPSALVVMRWLAANRIDYVLVGPVARALRGEAAAGPVAIVPAPYGRNLDRLARALTSAHARERSESPSLGDAGSGTSIRFSAEKLLGARAWSLRCGEHDLDVEGQSPGNPRYQELLYEATRQELDAGVAVEVAAPEHIEHFEHVRRTGTAPEIKVSRGARSDEQTVTHGLA